MSCSGAQNCVFSWAATQLLLCRTHTCERTLVFTLITRLIPHPTNWLDTILLSKGISTCKRKKGLCCVFILNRVEQKVRPVIGFVSAGLMNLNDDEDMLEMGADGLWSEGQCAGLLKHDCHDVVTDVSLPQQLTEQNRHAEKRVKETRQSHYGLLRETVTVWHVLHLKNLQRTTS